jgi:hypothetical protein
MIQCARLEPSTVPKSIEQLMDWKVRRLGWTTEILAADTWLSNCPCLSNCGFFPCTVVMAKSRGSIGKGRQVSARIEALRPSDLCELLQRHAPTLATDDSEKIPANAPCRCFLLVSVSVI